MGQKIMSQNEITTKLLLLEILGNIKIQNAIVSIVGDKDSLTFTNQANETFTFELQNIDVDKLVSMVLGSANEYSDKEIKALKNEIEQSLKQTSDNFLNSIESLDQKIVKDLSSLSKSTSKQISKLDDRFANYITKTDVTKQIEVLDQTTNLKLSAIDVSVVNLEKNDESLKIELNQLHDFLKELNLDFVQDVKFQGNYAYVTKDGKTKKYLLPIGGYGSGGGGGGGEEFKYTNPVPTDRRVGGIPKGSTFNQATSKTMWNLLLYGEDDPYFSTFNIDYKSVYEVGEPIVNQQKTAYWGINNTKLLEPNSIKIKYINEEIVVAENLPNTGFYSFTSPDIVFNVPTKVDFRIFALSVTEVVLQDLFSFYYKHRIYVGNNTLEVINESDIKLLQLTDLVDTIEGKYPVGPGGYKWICYPQLFGVKKSFKDFSTDIDIEMEDPILVSVTNSYGVIIEYYCHRSFYKLGAEMEIVVS